MRQLVHALVAVVPAQAFVPHSLAQAPGDVHAHVASAFEKVVAPSPYMVWQHEMQPLDPIETQLVSASGTPPSAPMPPVPPLPDVPPVPPVPEVPPPPSGLAVQRSLAGTEHESVPPVLSSMVQAPDFDVHCL